MVVGRFHRAAATVFGVGQNVAVLTGTRLVRLSDGGRIGSKAPWAMTVRTVLLPLLIGTFVVGAVAGGSPPGSPVRVSIDRRDTGRRRAAGHR